MIITLIILFIINIIFIILHFDKIIRNFFQQPLKERIGFVLLLLFSLAPILLLLLEIVYAISNKENPWKNK